MTGTDSPVNMDSSTIQGPRNRRRSQGTSFSSCERPNNTNSSSLHFIFVQIQTTKKTVHKLSQTSSWMHSIRHLLKC